MSTPTNNKKEAFTCHGEGGGSGNCKHFQPSTNNCCEKCLGGKIEDVESLCDNPSCKCHADKGESHNFLQMSGTVACGHCEPQKYAVSDLLNCACNCHKGEAVGDGSVRCCDNGDFDEKHDCQKQAPTQPESSWSDRFEKFRVGKYSTAGTFADLKTFIRTEIEAAEERGRKEGYEEGIYQPAQTVSLTKEYKKGRRDALAETIDFILKQENKNSGGPFKHINAHELTVHLQQLIKSVKVE